MVVNYFNFLKLFKIFQIPSVIITDYYHIFMEDIFRFVQKYSSTIQQCLIAKDPIAAIKSLPSSADKNLLLLLLQPHSANLKETLLNKFNIRGSILEAIDQWKANSLVSSAKKPQDVKHIIEQFLKLQPNAFNYPKPAEFHTAADDDKSSDSALPSKLKPVKPLVEWVNEWLDKNEDQITTLGKKAIMAISQARLLKLKTQNKEQFLCQQYLREMPDKFAVEFVKHFYEEKLKTNKNYEIPNHILYNLSKSQFMLLKDAIPNLINKDEYLQVWFAHSYDQQLELFQKSDLTISEKDEKRKVMVKILSDLEKLKTARTKAMRRNILRELLLLDISRDQVDKALFIEYVRDNPTSSSYEKQKFREQKQQYKSKAKAYQQDDIDLHIQSYSASTGEDQIIKESIECLFKRSDAEKILNQLEQFFESSKLNKIYATVKLSEGAKIEDFENYLTADELRQLKEQREITILDKNKKKWRADEPIELKVRVKNIKDIHVQVYKIDLEKHFSEDSPEIDQTQNLSYMQPNHSYHYTTDNSNPFRVQIYDIKIEGIPIGRGVWIIELEGEGISSRAFIRKGSMVNAIRNNSAGTELKFYDQTGLQVVDYSIWMEGKKHIVKSAFTIPYGESDNNVSLVVAKDGYAERFNVYVPREDYYFDISYIYNSESFLVGSIAKVLLHPRLNISCDRNMEVSFKLLEKVKILVTLTNNLGIKSTIDFDNVQFKSTEDYVLEFPIQSYTSNIDISVSAKVKKYNKKEQNLTSGHTININLSEGNTNFMDIYIRKQKAGYVLHLLGKNGEPIPRTEVILQLQMEGRTSDEVQNLMTSKDGCVELGDLQGVEKVTARVNLKSGTVVREWDFNQSTNEAEFVVNSYFRAGEEVVLPATKKQKAQLWRVLNNSGVYTENHTDKLKFEESRLSIKGLPAGRYSLQLTEEGRRFEFNVIEGRKWEEENKIYDEKNSMLYEIDPNQNNHLVLGEAVFKKEENATVVEIPIRSTYDIKSDTSFRAHLLASNFLVPNFNNKFNVNNVRGFRAINTQVFVTKESTYFNNKRLAEEASYVVNRGSEKKYIGNNLEKPRVFLKRIEVRDTTQLDQVLDVGQQYLQKACDMRQQSRAFRPSNCPPQYPGGKGYGYGDVYSQSSSIPFANPLDLTTHNNFLSLPGTISSNQKGDIVRFHVPVGYSHFECCAFSRVTAIVRKFDLPIEEVEKKNLCHSGMQASSKDAAWTMSREVYKVAKGENIKVGRDSVWSAIGLANIVGFAKIKGATLEDWVTNWSTYSEEEKLKVYDEKVCHQLNTYIKFNDSAFFEKIVRPFIKNKVTKTFVDLCLLEDQMSLKWTSLDLFQQLNEFEKALLVQRLAKSGRKQEAEAIANMMENINKSQRKTFEQFKKQFDTVITAKLTQNVQKAQRQKKEGAKKMKKSVQRNRQCQMVQQKQMQMDCMVMSLEAECEDDEGQFNERSSFNQPFKQMEKTKQYTETTYSGIKFPHQSRNLVPSSPFWAALCHHFATGSTSAFLSENFMYLRSTLEFTLAACFVPNQKLLQYGLKSQADGVAIDANSNFLVFVREVKSLPFEKKFGVLLNQRFFNPDDRYYYEEDGTRIQKETEQFIVRKPYCVQTLITNTSGTKLELQLLIDIPEGSVPLQSHETTRIQSINLQPYSTLSFERPLYFPSVGTFKLYPANACRGSSVIAKADEIGPIQVLEKETVKKLDTLENVLKSGQKESILQYLQTKNIFDNKMFDPANVLWMLKDKDFFLKVIEVLRNRKFYIPEVWLFGFLHHDLKSVAELTSKESADNPQGAESILKQPPVFEYFPYYSSRAHKFLNENKSTIRNQEFKKTYFCFLLSALFNDPSSPRTKVALIYYLLLQDRIDEAHSVLSQIDEAAKQEHQLQFDYIECFIDMYKGYPTFARARKIVEKYVDYPVTSWQKMFKEIATTLKQYDSVAVVEEQKKVEFSTTVINEGHQLRISIPADTQVEVCIYDVNLQLYFSNFPFTDGQGFCSNIMPNSVQAFPAGDSREEKLVRPNDMKDCFIEVLSSTSGLRKKKVSAFLWTNPNIKIKVKEDNGYAQVFLEGKRQPGCYCKVYQMKNGQSKFYRDGYTDITGSFKYALADLEGVTEFAMLFVTDSGGVVERVKPPSQQAYLS